MIIKFNQMMLRYSKAIVTLHKVLEFQNELLGNKIYEIIKKN